MPLKPATKTLLKLIVQDLAIVLIVVAGVANLALSLPHETRFLESLGIYYSRLSHQTVALHRSLTAVIGFTLIILAYRLGRRIRMAWVIAVLTLAISAVLEIFRFHSVFNLMTLVEGAILLVLGLSYRDFGRRPNRLSLRRALLIAAVSLVLVVVYTGIGFHMNRGQFNSLHSIWDALAQSVSLLFLMNPTAIGVTTRTGRLIADTAITLNWASLLFAFVLVLKPLVYQPLQDHLTLARVRSLVNRFGQSPIAYLALEKDKKYFFSNRVEGVIAFDIVADVAICCGDMICADEDAAIFLSDFLQFCRQNHAIPAFINVTDHFMALYRSSGFQAVKYGEDAMFDLARYSLSGGRIAKVRAAINHGTKAGLVVAEYKPVEQRDHDIEKAFEAITNEWLATKKSGEMAFMLGGLGLDNPMDRRYFYTRDAQGQIVAFVVFLPFAGGKGYLADVTRRRSDAPQGALEKIIVEGFMAFKAEGAEWGSMGMAPLYQVREDPEAGLVGRLFEFIYENLNNLYGFKSLQHAKEKYAPTDWIPRHLVYLAPVFSARIAYALVKVQNPQGVSDYLLTALRKQIEAGKQNEAGRPTEAGQQNM